MVVDLFCRFMQDVFSVNERVVLSGSWAHGCMHMVAVAAYNVGNIRIAKEPVSVVLVPQGNCRYPARHGRFVCVRALGLHGLGWTHFPGTRD